MAWGGVGVSAVVRIRHWCFVEYFLLFTCNSLDQTEIGLQHASSSICTNRVFQVLLLVDCLVTYFPLRLPSSLPHALAPIDIIHLFLPRHPNQLRNVPGCRSCTHLANGVWWRLSPPRLDLSQRTRLLPSKSCITTSLVLAPTTPLHDSQPLQETNSSNNRTNELNSHTT